MTSLVEKVMNADKAVRDLYATMIEMLNQDDMDYMIEFQGEVWDFYMPLTQEEKDEMDERKSEVSLILLQDALQRLSDALPDQEHEDEYRYHFTSIWINIANLQRFSSKQDRISAITSEQPYEVDEGTSKPLDLESIYLQAQRKDLSDEEKWSLLLGNVVDKQSVSKE